MFVEQHEDRESDTEKIFARSRIKKIKSQKHHLYKRSLHGSEGETVQFLDRSGGAGRGKSHRTAVREGDDMVRRKQMSLCKLKF